MSSLMSQLLENAGAYLPNFREDRLIEAYNFAKTAHKGQKRKDGSKYVTHPLKAAIILTDLHVDEDTLVACLLHDVPEDTNFTLEDIEMAFGKKVGFLVNGITKLSKVHYRDNMEERQIESLKKLFIHCAQDPRIILIKLADRLHNMYTIDAIEKPQKRLRIAKETLEIYVPIANLLGIWDLKSELEDLCFKTISPDEYNNIEELAKESALKKKDVLIRTKKIVRKLLQKNGLNDFQIRGRKKSYYSIYKKMLNTGKTFQEIYDLIGLRVVLKNVGDCYHVLGVFHQNFTPKPGRLKDYIAIPKINGYQSIHTTVFGVDGTITEIQIRTKEMDLECTYGVAAHFFYTYKIRSGSVRKRMKNKSEWVQRILDIQRDMENNKEFLNQLKLDIFEDRIFVFSPKGDVVDLPKGSQVLDFAYLIHSEIGNKAVSAVVNGNNKNLSAELMSGDVIAIETSSDPNYGPKLNWLNIVKTSNAKNKIREFLKKQNRERIISEAIDLFENRISVLGFDRDYLNDSQKEWLASVFYKDSWETLMYALGEGSIDIQDLMRFLQEEKKLIGEMTDPENEHVYDHVLNRLPNALHPKKVYRVHFMIHCRNRVGLLRDVSIKLADLNINILRTNTWHSANAKVSTLEFYIEITDINQYDEIISVLSEIPDVIKIMRLQNAELSPLNPSVARTMPEL